MQIYISVLRLLFKWTESFHLNFVIFYFVHSCLTLQPKSKTQSLFSLFHSCTWSVKAWQVGQRSVTACSKYIERTLLVTSWKYKHGFTFMKYQRCGQFSSKDDLPYDVKKYERGNLMSK